MVMDEGAPMREAVDVLTKFSLDRLDSSWIKAVIDGDFTEVEDLPAEFAEVHSDTRFQEALDAAVGSLRRYVDSLAPADADADGGKRLSVAASAGVSGHREDLSSLNGTREEGDGELGTRFWAALAAESLSVKGLKAFLFYFLHKGQRYGAKEEDRECAIRACSLYFLLLCVPGSNAFRVFHPVLYTKSVEVLRLSSKLKVGATTQRGRPPLGGRGGGSQGRKSQDELSSQGDDDEEEEEEGSTLSPAEATKLTRSLNHLFDDFFRLTKRFSLKHSAECLDETVGILVEVSRCETQDAQGVFLRRHGPSSVTALSHNAYVALQCVCDPVHGKLSRIVIVVMKHIMHSILMIARGSSDSSPRALGVIRDHSQIFVKYILTQVKEEAYEGVYILIQHICIRVPDRAEFRQKTAQSVVEILRYLPIQLYTRLVKWFFKFSHNEKAGHRLFMLEVIAKMLDEKERVEEGTGTPVVQQPARREKREVSEDSSDSDSDSDCGVQRNEGSTFLKVNVDHPVEAPPDRNVLSHKFLLGIIFSRCRDSGATVRAKALALLAECTYSKNPTIILAMKQIFFQNRPLLFTTPHIDQNNINIESPLEQEGEENLDLPNAAMMVSMLHRRALDNKAIVRRSALQVLENLMKLDKELLNVKNLEVLMEHCRDPALLIRKQMITSLSALVEAYPENEDVIICWIKGVFPLILDPEVKVQEKVTELLDQLVFRRLVPYSERQEETPDQKLPWVIVATVTKLSFHKFFNKAVMIWAKSEYKRPQIVKVVRTHMSKEHNEEMWTLLASLSNYLTVTDAAFVVNYFEEQCQEGSKVGSYTLQQVLKVLSNSIKNIPNDRAEALHDRLLRPITHFNVGAQLISPMMDTLTLLTYSMHGNEEEGLVALEKWVAPILKSCDDHLASILFQHSLSSLDAEEEEKLFRHIFTLGEASMLCPRKVNRRMFLLIQSIIFQQTGKEARPLVIPASQTQSSQPPSISYKPTTRVRAVAIVALGKMCLQHEEQAKRIIPALGKMLDMKICPALRINIVFTLSDMCVRYATLVDPLMPQVTACLRDPDLEVRRTTLTLLINLLQEDYLKLKGSFFYRILQCLTDDHDEIRSTVIFYVTERLLKRFPKILCQHFIECIFHYNCYEEHESYNRFSQSSKEKELFSLAGKEHMEERMMIYKFMLDHMQDDQRFTTTHRLIQDVLGGLVDGRIKLSPGSLPMLEDTLNVLRSDEIKLASLKSRPEDADQPADQAEEAAMAGMVIKKTIISQVVKRSVIENVVPILIAVKHKLEEHRSPLMKHLLLYFKELMKDYKNEVKEILAGDKQLAQEIEFDLRRLDQEEKEREEEELKRRQAEKEVAADVQDDAGECANDLEKSLSLGTSPSLKKNGPEMIPKTPTAVQNKLHKMALLNSKAITNRRRSSLVPVPFIQDSDSNLNSRETRASLETQASHSQNAAQVQTPKADGEEENVQAPKASDVERQPNSDEEVGKEAGPLQEEVRKEAGPLQEEEDLENNASEKDDTHIDPRPIGGNSPVRNVEGTPKGKTLKSTRDKLLRAISTPHHKPGVISNITFIDETQDLSAITVNTSAASLPSVTEQPKLVLHLQSPEAFAKESDFSQLRRASRETDRRSESKGKAAKSIRKSNPEIFDSLASVETELDSDNSDLVPENQSAQKGGARVEEAVSKGKRTRHMASLSPYTKEGWRSRKIQKPK
ncbi:LOW QUALITY PROTEIN: condensin-2 complex subunit D3-L-like [Macrobrachium nipponense]|uniref:LOW QUALITY PROTEIN: condensin-2 complex subunit D3-L-like n=1 Tax=Macrobrachium nipponense TaxID=159736 RepID=UPI0030C7B569